jgi:branched-chain amino acid transport system permease protein
MAVALAIGIPSLHLQGYYLSVATLGFGIILHICFIEMATLTGGPSGLVGIPELSLFGLPLNTDRRYYFLVWLVVGVTLVGCSRLVDSRLGRALRAIGADETAATLAGINTWAAKLQIFMIAAAIASLGGSLYAHYITFLSPDSFGFMFSVELIVMVVVGGTRSLWGSVVGAVLLTVLPEYLRVMKDYDVLVYGAVVIVMVMWAPAGIAGLARRAFARWQPAAARGAVSA